MKVNMNQISDKGPKPEKHGPGKRSSARNKKADRKQMKKQKPEDTVSQENNNGNVYKESFKMYADKAKAQAKPGGLFYQNKFWVGVIVILFFVFLSVNSNAAKTRTQLTVKFNRAVTETDRLNTAIDEVKADLEEQARIDSIKLTEEEEELARNDAKVQGEMVAHYQNLYREILSPESMDIDKEDAEKYKEAQDDYVDALNDNKNALGAYFDDNGKRIGKAEWYNSESGIPGKWEFASRASFKGNTAKVLWLCHADEDHTLLAYCTGKYNADTELFTDMELKKTAYAIANTKSDGDDPTETEQITSIQDALKSLAESNGMPDSSEEFTEETISNNNDATDAREALKNAVKNGKVEGETYDAGYDVGLGESLFGNYGDSQDPESAEPESSKEHGN